MKKLKQKFNDITIRKKLIILLCVVGFVPVTIMAFFISINAGRTVVMNRKADMSSSLELACASVTNQLSICDQMMQYFINDQGVIAFLECSPERKTERYSYYQELQNEIFALQYQNLMMNHVTVYSEEITKSFGEETQPLELLEEEAWFQENLSDGQWVFDENSGEMITAYKIPGSSGKRSYVVVRADIDTMFQSLIQLASENSGVVVYNKDGFCGLISKDGINIHGNMEDYQKNNRSFIWVEEKIQNPDISVVYYQPRNTVRIVSWNMFLGFLILFGACLALILLLGRFLADYISRPLEMLTDEIKTVGENKIGTGIESDRKDEAGILIRSYNRMMNRIQELIQENYETKIAQKEFEMRALQAQINPHFLYNSLSIINWKAIEAGEDEISNITLALSSFYRTTLNKGNTMISVRMALENIQAYLKLQLWMHDDDFQVNYEIDEAAYDFMIPSLIFQPFVENALEHGLDVKEDPDHQLWISVRQDADSVYVEIRDNGVGMDEDTLEHILEYQAKGYGVKNVNDRMILHYGEAYGVHIESSSGKGTDVLLTFPKKQEEKTVNAGR